MAGETRKQDVAKEYIENNILNKDLLDIQGNILGELNSLKESVESSLVDIKSILGSEKVGQNEETPEKHEINLTERVMKLLFNEKGEVKNGVLYNLTKYFNGAYYIIGEKGREKLDLLREYLNKSKTEQELRNNLNNELKQLENDVLNPGNSNGGNNQGGYENLSSIESKADKQISEQYIYKQAKLYGVTDNRQIAYILAIVKGECGFKNIKEFEGENASYGQVDSSTGKAYYGRGFLQLTHKGNYKKYSKIIRESGLNFRDNDGNIIMGSSVDLEKDPDLVLNSNDLASFILIDWMKNGGPYRQETKKLSHYINNNKTDFFNARYIINGDKNKLNKSGQKIGDMYKGYAEDYLGKLGNGNVAINNIDTQLINNREILAEKRCQLGGIGSSIMNGIINDGNSVRNPENSFINMNGINSATTTNNKRFEENGDELLYNGIELGKYCKNNGIKSFMFYFGGNEAASSEPAVNKAYQNIEHWSNYLQSKGIQPVLCTCLYEDIVNHSVGHKGEVFPLRGFNQNIRNLGKQRGWPVIDFAEIQDDIPISPDQLHPTAKGYSMMRQIIDKKIGIS